MYVCVRCVCVEYNKITLVLFLFVKCFILKHISNTVFLFKCLFRNRDRNLDLNLDLDLREIGI